MSSLGTLSLPKKAFAWSFSALKSFETCPKKWASESYYKNVPRETTKVGDWGADAHKAIEERILRKRPFPLGMTQFEPLVSRFIDAPGITYAERKMAINRSYQPTEYFGTDVWLRAQGDAAKHNDRHFALVDWKF